MKSGERGKQSCTTFPEGFPYGFPEKPTPNPVRIKNSIKEKRRPALTLVEVMISIAIFVLMIGGIFTSLLLSAKIHRRSQARLEAFTLASFLADQLRIATPAVIDAAAQKAGGADNTISITLPPNVLSFGSRGAKKGILNYDLKVEGAAPFGTKDINDADINYAQAMIDRNPTSWSAPGGNPNALQIDQRTQDLGTDDLGKRIAYQLAIPVGDKANTRGSAMSGKNPGLINANAVVIIQRNVRMTRGDAAGKSYPVTDYTIRVDVALDKEALPGGEPSFASARTYVCPTIFSSPNVLLVK